MLQKYHKEVTKQWKSRVFLRFLLVDRRIGIHTHNDGSGRSKNIRIHNTGTIYFFRENPHLCKNMIGEYISNKKNLDVLKSFVMSFDFRGLR
jgi:hypothetical protein